MDMWSTKLGNEAMEAMISMSHSIKDISKKLDDLNLKANTITDSDIKEKCDKSNKQGYMEGFENAANDLFDSLTFYLAYKIVTTKNKCIEDKNIMNPILYLLMSRGFSLESIFEEIYLYVDRIAKASEPENAVIMSHARTVGLDMAIQDIDYTDFIKEYNF